jgi:hypothetical protein
MLKSLSLSFVLVLTTAACGGGAKTAPTPAAPIADTAPVAASGTTLALAEMKLVDVNKNKAILIHKDGTIEFEGQKPAKVTADGKLVKADTGEVFFQLQPDGSIKTADGTDVGVKISPDGALTMGDKTISLDDTGLLVGGNPNAPQMKVEGATDANLKRTAMFVLVVITAPAAPPAAPPTQQ